MTASFPFANSYARLPERFFARVGPTPVASPRLVQLNRPLAEYLCLDPDWLAGPAGVEMLAGKALPDAAEPIAMAYAGHQFGQFVPQLGDGRALLIGDVAARDGSIREIHLKGSGPTPFSRGGDGRAALGPILREYVVSEAMAALGIPTTRALAVVTTGETVVRETLLPGAVLTRVASSFVRVGTFEFFAARGDAEGVRLLADRVIARHYPDAAASDRPYRALLDAVIARQSDLIARWLLVGFIHGVMNTDNTSLAGETIDYGPCAFLDAYHPNTVFSSIDAYGRYAYANQPTIAQWNMARLAEALLPLLSDEEDEALAGAEEALNAFGPRFEAAFRSGMRAKLGFFTAQDDDVQLAERLLAAMAENRADFTLTFRRLSEAAADAASDDAVRSLFDDPSAYDAWALRWRRRLDGEEQSGAVRRAAMRSVNPAYIPRNHRLEAVIESATADGNFGPFEELLTVLAKPYEDQPAYAAYAAPPSPGEEVHRTFCGT